jgi:outer membrane protein assembly factor BamB
MTNTTLARQIRFSSLIALILAQSHGADWPQWRGPDCNGISKETGWKTQWPAEGPKQLWKAKVGTGFSSFAIAGGRVYTMGNTDDTDTVFCFKEDTGEVLWKHSYPQKLEAKNYEGGPNATPTVAGDKVYTISKNADIFCLDAAKGSVVWSKKLAEELGTKKPTWAYASSVLVEGNLLLVNVGGAGTALNQKDGQVVWSNGKDVANYSTPVPFNAGGQRAAALFTKDHIAAVLVADGKELWRYPWKTSYDVNAADPVIAGNEVFISSGYNHGAALLRVTDNKPEKVWENKNMRNHFNSSVLWKEHLYGVNEDDLGCVVWKTGETKWSDSKFGKGSLILADGKIIGLGEKGELLIAEATPDAFKPLARAQVLGGKCWTAPALANGRIYCRNAAGDVVCLDVRGN